MTDEVGFTMTAPRPDFDAALARWSAERAAARGPHPELEAWGLYVAGQAPEAEAEALEAHLALCRECAGLVRELRRFVGDLADEVPVAERPTEFERAAAWRALRAELARRGLVRDAAPPAGGPFRLPRALAASLVVGALALGLWGAVLQRQVADLRHQVVTLRAPQKNVPIYDLYPDAATRGPEAGTAELERRFAPTATVILNVIGEQDYEDFAVEVVGEDGEVVWTDRGFEPDPDFGTFTLGLPVRDLAEERYRVRLYGLRGAERTLIEDYPLVIH